jgi:hypothetical protein
VPRRATLALVVVLLAGAGVAVWALWPITDPLGRSCGGGVFASSQERWNDDSYLDVCNGLRDERRAAVVVPAVVAAFALVGAGAWFASASVAQPSRLT